MAGEEPRKIGQKKRLRLLMLKKYLNNPQLLTNCGAGT